MSYLLHGHSLLFIYTGHAAPVFHLEENAANVGQLHSPHSVQTQSAVHDATTVCHDGLEGVFSTLLFITGTHLTYDDL